MIGDVFPKTLYFYLDMFGKQQHILNLPGPLSNIGFSVLINFFG